MALYLYAPILTDSVLELTKALGAKRLKKFDGMGFWKEGKRFPLAEGDVLICWGKPIPELDGVRVLNSGSPATKLQDLRALSNIGVRIPQVRTSFYPGYLQRLVKSKSGNDLLESFSCAPDYYTGQIAFSEEYVIHSFEGRSIRSGKKVMKPGLLLADTPERWKENPARYAHPWVRTDLGGWMVEHDGFKSTMQMRKQAAFSVKSLELRFGAVTMGSRLEDGQLVTLGIDRAPFIEGVTINSYVRSIQRWIREEKPEGEEEPGEIDAAPPQDPGLRLDVAGWNPEPGGAQIYYEPHVAFDPPIRAAGRYPAGARIQAARRRVLEDMPPAAAPVNRQWINRMEQMIQNQPPLIRVDVNGDQVDLVRPRDPDEEPF